MFLKQVTMGGQPPSIPPRKRRRTRLACHSCRARKVGCDGNRPYCTACSMRGQVDQCIYQQQDLSNPTKVSGLANSVRSPDPIGCYQNTNQPCYRHLLVSPLLNQALLEFLWVDHRTHLQSAQPAQCHRILDLNRSQFLSPQALVRIFMAPIRTRTLHTLPLLCCRNLRLRRRRSALHRITSSFSRLLQPWTQYSPQHRNSLRALAWRTSLSRIRWASLSSITTRQSRMT